MDCGFGQAEYADGPMWADTGRRLRVLDVGVVELKTLLRELRRRTSQEANT